MLYSEIIAVCSQIHTKDINTLCGQNVEFFKFKSGGRYSNHCANRHHIRGSQIVILSASACVQKPNVCVSTYSCATFLFQILGENCDTRNKTQVFARVRLHDHISETT
jgi:hypothetical protein